MGRATFAKYRVRDDNNDETRGATRRRLFRKSQSKVRRPPFQRFKIVDLFCGCGGLSFGLESTKRFETILAIDSSQDAIATFAQNHRRNGYSAKTVLADIAELDPKMIRVELRGQGILTGQLDCLIAGPPCEGFSQNHGKKMAGRGDVHLVTNGHSTRGWYRPASSANTKVKQLTRGQLDDERNDLFRKILSVAVLIRPKIVLIENVPEFLTYDSGSVEKEIVNVLSEAGYRVEVRILNAADYGVPQYRKRAFIVAARKDIAKAFGQSFFPKRTHRERRTDDAVGALMGDAGVHITTLEAIGDLPAAGQKCVSKQKPSIHEFSDFRKFVRGRMRGVPTQHTVRSVTPTVLKRIKALKQGMKVRDLPSHLRTKKYYANAYARLNWHEPANTVTKSFYNLGSGKFCHPTSNRGITIREAARLQSFPDHFEFVGSSLRSLGAMIGGAVPPLLARSFGMRFADALDHAIKRPASNKRQQK
jgi:DNA (cytosine-5)-methyltransferase 1